MNPRPVPARRGTIYVLVLMTSVIVTLIGIIAHRMVQSQARVARIDAQRDEAAALAESAVQWGVHYVTLKSDWRTATSSGDVVRTMPLGEGQISIVIADADGDLDDRETEEFTITGTGRIGDAVQTYAVDLAFGTGAAHPALDNSVTVGGTLYVNQNVLWTGSRAVARAVRRQDGSAYVLGIGSPATVANPVDLPHNSLIDIWADKGTLITRAMHGGTISGATLSSVAAPFGITPDPDGIYTIDANGSGLLIAGSIIDGTVIIRNLGGNDVRIAGTRITLGDHGGPTLIVDGSADLELGAGGMNEGIVYIKGDARIDDFMSLIGTVMVTGDLRINTASVIISDPATPDPVPAEGFTELEGLAIVPGSWRRIVD